MCTTTKWEYQGSLHVGIRSASTAWWTYGPATSWHVRHAAATLAPMSNNSSRTLPSLTTYIVNGMSHNSEKSLNRSRSSNLLKSTALSILISAQNSSARMIKLTFAQNALYSSTKVITLAIWVSHALYKSFKDGHRYWRRKLMPAERKRVSSLRSSQRSKTSYR